ncbi:MAG: hypothetical protein PUJ55_06480 [Clostridiales bacterium]|nr:hypothetical protein [Roseburia sp.]MDD7636568.1 hypothetical protein [Clostridiales bacterium]MDY4112052.1 hypothetical protein [Roseburia sp.]
MKKKLLTAVLSAVLCLGMSVTAMAATSPSAGIPSSDDVTMGNVSNDFYTNATQAQTEALDAFYEKVELMESEGSGREVYNVVAGELIAATAGVSVKVEFATILEVSATDISKPVRFEAPGISAGNSIVVLHLKADSTWENIPAVAGTWGYTLYTCFCNDDSSSNAWHRSCCKT